MMHPATELRFISEEVGFGVFARQPIPRGTITWTADELDQRFTRDQVGRLHPLCQEAVYRYSYIDPEGVFVLCWDHGRYVNHSCDPNCLSAGFQFEFAVRDIASGEQLTDDYGLMNLESPMECRCGSAECRGIIYPDDVVDHAHRWDTRVREAFDFIGRVNQPLWPVLAEANELEEALRGIRPIPSCGLHQVRRT
jgi:hypothetical protein